MSIDIQIWSDIACPWCYIGKRRFEKALEAFPQRDQVTVTWRSFQLDPTLPERDERSEVDYLVERKGMPRAQVEQMFQQITQVAADEGLNYDFDAMVVANSRRAHRVLQAAKLADQADGGTRAGALKEALLSAHFETAEFIGDPAVLIAKAVAAGLDEQTARDALDSAELDDAIDADIMLGQQIGVQGVPFFVFDNKYGISGAQPGEVFTQVLEKVAAEQAPKLITLDGTTGEACGPDGC